MSGARGRLGSHRAAESRGPGADSGAFVPRPGRSAGRELAGENGAGERLVVRADVLELAGILTVARHLLAQGVAVLAHRLLDLVRDDLLEQARLNRRRAGAIPRVHRKDVTSVAVSRRHHERLPAFWAVRYIGKEYARGALRRKIRALQRARVFPVAPK